jgi:hypothetical protein
LIYAIFTFLDILLYTKVTRLELYAVELALLFFLLFTLLCHFSCSPSHSSACSLGYLYKIYDVALAISSIVLIFLLQQAETVENENPNSGFQIAIRVLRMLLFSNRIIFLHHKVSEDSNGANNASTIRKLREEIKFV